MKRFLTSIAFVLCALTGYAQFSGSGSGTESDPYRIFNADQLSQLRNFLNQEGVYFKLQNDINLTDWLADNYPSQGWQPVGSSTEPFKGILDGNNKTISGFSITRTSMDYVGLFGYVTGATIKDLTLKGTIKGKAYVGSLMGYGSATVTNYTFEGTVTGTGNYTGGVGGYQTTASTNLTITATVRGASYTGGIYGYGVGISSASFTGQVSGSSYTAGLEGQGSGTISSCTVSAPVTGTANYIAGLVGTATVSLTLSNSSQTGEVKSSSSSATYVGGLVGNVTSSLTITNGAHRGKVTGKDYTGGIVGGMSSGTLTLSSCYAECNIVGNSYVGGICGEIKGPTNSNISGCNFWGDISGTSHLGGVVGQIICTNVSDINFTTTTTAGYKKYTGSSSGYSYSSTATFYKSSSPSLSVNSSGGSVLSTSIADINDWAKSFHDVYTSSTGTTKSVPYVVYNNIRTTSTGRYVNIQNCSAVSNINGIGTYIGGIVGKDVEATNDATYTLSTSKTVYYFVGSGTKSETTSITLKGYSYVYTTSNISESYFSGKLTGTDYIGGIAGTKQGGCINNCYSSASISGGQYLGGIAGYLKKASENTNDNSMNANVSACTSITGTQNVGRIYGYTDGNFTVAPLGTNSENRSMVSTQVIVNGVTQTIEDNLQNGTAVGVSQLRLRANYVAWGWDFNNCWTIQETESFPYKTWQSAPPTFSGDLTSGATTISGQSVDGGTVYLTTSSGKSYTATCSGSSWTKTVSALHAGETVTAYAAGTNKEKSYFTTTTVGFLGSGTEADPYQIASAEDLQGLNKGGYYKIINDIDLTAWINQYSSSKGWLPVGYDGAAVYIDGDNHKITGLWTNSTDTYTGLFSKLKDGYIKNLNVEVASGKKVKGGQYTGILIAYASNFKFLNCSVKGNAEGTTYVGGIVGYFTGSSSNPNLSDLTYEGTLTSSTVSANIGGIAGYGSSCRMYHAASTVQVTSTGNNALIGGLVGKMYGRTASQCTADVNINASGTGNKVGGLFGTAGYTTSTATTITETSSTGIIQATGSDSWAGGIAGHLITNAQLSDSYSTVTITGTQYTAGLVGQASAASKINRCYATGNLTGVYYGAGIVGKLNDANTKTTNCVALNSTLSYTDQSAWASRVIGGYDEASGDPDGSNLALATMQVSLNNVPVTKYDDLVEGIAKSESELKQAAAYEAKGWNFESVWTMPENGYPLLKWQLPASILATGISLNNTTYNFTEIGQTITLVATIAPADVTDNTVTWTSSNTAVATVSNTGVVTAVAEGTATITATTNDGTNLSAQCTITVVEDIEFIAGDVNSDNAVDVSDYLTIANYILGQVPTTFNEAAADVTQDSNVDVADYLGVANIILYGNYQGPQANSANAIKALTTEQASPWMGMEVTEDGLVELLLHDTPTFSAFQMDIFLPEGIEIYGANMSKANQTRNLSYAQLQNGAWRLLYGTMDGKTVNLADHSLLTLKLTSKNKEAFGGIDVEGITLVRPNTSVMHLNGVHGTLPTGISDIESMMPAGNNCYDLTGRKVTENRLKKGFYIINGKKIAIK